MNARSTRENAGCIWRPQAESPAGHRRWGGSWGVLLASTWLATALVGPGCEKQADPAKAEAYLQALQAQSDYVATRADAICSDPSALTRHSAIQGLLRDLKQYRIDFEGQTACTKRSQCGPPDAKAHAPPVFRGVKPDEPDAQGAELSKATFARLRDLMADDAPQPLRDALLGCQSEAMAVAAAAAVLIVTCTTKPGTTEEQRDRDRLGQAKQQLAAAIGRVRVTASSGRR